ncbi:MAG: hypothetical protein B6226_03055 [Candidatus Cloacimonetes bacterium 4572_65]|nr:MAG: hypothetical protein B6226_03055 [Candidatus Cloacimonetes bacterium 4572_65]
MSNFFASIGSFLADKGVAIIAPYKDTNIAIQLLFVVVLGILALFISRIITNMLKKNYYKIINNHFWSVINDFFVPIQHKLIVAVLFSFTAQVMKYFGGAAPILRIISVVLFFWIVIKLASRLVKNPFFKKVLIYSSWIIIILNLLNLYSDMAILLESISVTISGIKVSLYGIMRSVVYLGVLSKITSVLIEFVSQRINLSNDLNPSVKVLLIKVIKVVGFTMATILFINIIGINLSSLALFTSALGVGIGFGLQNLVSNLISGVTLLVDNSLKPGDVIEVDNHFGTVKVMGSRYTSIVTVEGKEHLIPNEYFISNEVVNWSHSNKLVRQTVEVGVSYNSDVKKVMMLLEEAVNQIPRVLKRPKAKVFLTNFGASSVDFNVTFWVNDPQAGVINVKSDVLVAIWDILKQNNIEIPFPQQDIHIKSFEYSDIKKKK